MAAKSKRLPSPGVLIIIFFVCLSAADLAVFYLLPMHFLYPETGARLGTGLEKAAILFHDFNGDFTGINEETRRRIHHGIALLEKEKVNQLIVVGGNREGSRKKGAQLMADYLHAQGVPVEQILVEANSKDSISNLQQLRKFLSKNDHPVGLISSPYHLLRIRAMDLPLEYDIRYVPYNPSDCFPPLTRNELWFSVHYNGIAYLAHILLPDGLYRKIVQWIRVNTDW